MGLRSGSFRFVCAWLRSVRTGRYEMKVQFEPVVQPFFFLLITQIECGVMNSVGLLGLNMPGLLCDIEHLGLGDYPPFSGAVSWVRTTTPLRLFVRGCGS